MISASIDREAVDPAGAAEARCSSSSVACAEFHDEFDPDVSRLCRSRQVSDLRDGHVDPTSSRRR
jgi:hypothetical protein